MGGSITEFLNEVYNMEETLPIFSNGAYLVSDYGLGPLSRLGEELIDKHTPEDIIVVISKILDVTHPRSDLAELFIEGGSKSLEYIQGLGELTE